MPSYIFFFLCFLTFSSPSWRRFLLLCMSHFRATLYNGYSMLNSNQSDYMRRGDPLTDLFCAAEILESTNGVPFGQGWPSGNYQTGSSRTFNPIQVVLYPMTANIIQSGQISGINLTNIWLYAFRLQLSRAGIECSWCGHWKPLQPNDILSANADLSHSSRGDIVQVVRTIIDTVFIKSNACHKLAIRNVCLRIFHATVLHPYLSEWTK